MFVRLATTAPLIQQPPSLVPKVHTTIFQTKELFRIALYVLTANFAPSAQCFRPTVLLEVTGAPRAASVRAAAQRAFLEISVRLALSTRRIAPLGPTGLLWVQKTLHSASPVQLASSVQLPPPLPLCAVLDHTEALKEVQARTAVHRAQQAMFAQQDQSILKIVQLVATGVLREELARTAVPYAQLETSVLLPPSIPSIVLLAATEVQRQALA